MYFAGQEILPDGTVWQWSFPILSDARKWYQSKTVEQVRRDNPDNPLIKPGPATPPPVTDLSHFTKPVYTNNVKQWDHSNLSFEEWINEHYHQDQNGAWQAGATRHVRWGR